MNQYQNQFDELRRQGQLAEAREVEKAKRQKQADKKYASINLRGLVSENKKVLIQRARERGLVKNAFDAATFVSEYVAAYIASGEEAAERLFSA